MVVGLAIIFDAAQHVLHRTTLGEPHVYVVWIALFSVLLNEFIYQYTRKVANRINSDMLHANALHSRSDAAASLVVLIGVVGSLLGFSFLDPIAAVIVGILIIKMGFTLGLSNVNELVDAGVDPETLEKIRHTILSVHGVKNIHLLRTRKMAGRILVDVHLIVSPYLSVSEGHHIGDHVLKNLYSGIENVSDVTVHVDSEDDELYSECATLPLREALLPQLADHWKHLPGAENIKNITLHYLAGKIIVDITLPLALIQSHSANDLKQLYRKCLNSMPALQDIKIRFEI
jgi:cation diffusion facilitator family transporter